MKGVTQWKTYSAEELRELAVERARYMPRGIGPQGVHYYTSARIWGKLVSAMSNDIADCVDEFCRKAEAVQKEAQT